VFPALVIVQRNARAIDGLHELIQKVLTTPAYREKAQYFRDVTAKRPGLDAAAEAIERAFEQAVENRPLELSSA
jgi:zeaxanthin glucosyltransferase